MQMSFPVWHPGPYTMSEHPPPLELNRQDPTLGGMIFEMGPDGKMLNRPTGHRMRGGSEAIVMASLAHRDNLRLYYDPWGLCVGMGV